ncbi:MAG: hypothetical protein Fur005_39980 [Roseiflexaceae bacterium]
MLTTLIGIVPSPAHRNETFTPMPFDQRPFGINTHLASRTTDLNALDLPADLIVQSGAGWAREDIHWYRIQPTPDTWDWSSTDAAIKALSLRGIQIVGVIGHPPGWATPDGRDASNGFSFYGPDPALFATFAQAVAVRYSRYITHWQIWNEPDNPAFWKPSPDPTAYTRLLINASAAIHQAVPQAQVVIAGTNPFDTHFLSSVAASGGWAAFDILAIHPYVNPTAPEVGNLSAAIDAMHALKQKYGERPLWVTEIGWTSRADPRQPSAPADANLQANYLVRASLLLWRSGVERIFWYTLKDDPEGDTYGMFALGAGRSDFSQPKPAYSAFQTLSRQVANASYGTTHDLFQRSVAIDFEEFGVWMRGDQPNGRFSATNSMVHAGRGAGALTYNFPGTSNDYVVFRRAPAAPLPGTPSAVGVWVYGDNSGHLLKLWLRDSEGEILQYTLGAVGSTAWRLMQASLSTPVQSWDRITSNGNGKLDFPIRLEAIVLDDSTNSAMGSGQIILDDVTAASGPEAYDLRLNAGQTPIDVLWSPQPMLVSIASPGRLAQISDRDGSMRTVAVTDGRIVLPIGPAPVYVRHGR